MSERLTDPWFEAEFIGRANEQGGFTRQGVAIDGAQGVFLWCPCAFGHDEHAHGLVIPFANPRGAPACPENFGPKSRDGSHRPRWNMIGDSLDTLTLTPSVDVGTPSCWHGFITLGEVT